MENGRSLANRAGRVAEVVRAEALVEGEVRKFNEWWETQMVVPTIRALRDRAEGIRQAEIDRTLAKLPDLSPRKQAAIKAPSAAIVNKLLHQPIANAPYLRDLISRHVVMAKAA